MNTETMKCRARGEPVATSDVARLYHNARLDSLQAKLLRKTEPTQHEIVMSMLSPGYLRTLMHLLQDIMVPLIGLCEVPEVLARPLGADDRSDQDQDQDQEAYLQEFRDLLMAVVGPVS